MSPAGNGYRVPHHTDVAPEFAFDLILDVTELVGAGT